VGYDSSRAFTGRVTRVSALPAADTAGFAKLYPAVVTLDGGNSDFSLRPGMNAEVEILAGIVADTITVPLAAVRSERGRNYVWVKTDDGPLAAVVGLGANNATHVEVTTGLREGDQVYLATPRGDPVVNFQVR
jgi:HlyD family secretion protein